MEFTVGKLEGSKSLEAFNAFNALLLGLKMLPAHQSLKYDEFYGAFNEMTEDEKESLVREAVAFVKIDREELGAIISICKDKNGVPFSRLNAEGLPLNVLFEMVVAVAMEIGKIKVSLLSENEKKKSQILA